MCEDALNMRQVVHLANKWAENYAREHTTMTQYAERDKAAGAEYAEEQPPGVGGGGGGGGGEGGGGGGGGSAALVRAKATFADAKKNEEEEDPFERDAALRDLLHSGVPGGGSSRHLEGESEAAARQRVRRSERHYNYISVYSDTLSRNMCTH